MRFPRIYEEDGCCTAAVCDLCGEIYQGQAYYRINGRTVCRDCLADYAESYFADCLCGEEAAPW